MSLYVCEDFFASPPTFRTTHKKKGEKQIISEMEAPCFMASKSFSKTLDLVASVKARGLVPHSKKRSTQQFSRTAITCHNLRSSLPDDDSEVSVPSDWRSFRARLVAREQASMLEDPAATTWISSSRANQNSSHVVLGDKWAHPLHEPEKGCLLIASEKLDGVHIFERTVILILSTGPVCPTGIILNRPSLMSIKETRSSNLDSAGKFSDRPLFFGGPLEEGLFLVSSPKEKEDGVGKSGVFDEVMKGVYYGTKESVGCAAEMVKRNVVGVGDFRFFDGCCVWEKEQLREEIRSGYWSVVACSPSVIGLGSVGRVGMWEEVLGLVGERKVW